MTQRAPSLPSGPANRLATHLHHEASPPHQSKCAAKPWEASPSRSSKLEPFARVSSGCGVTRSCINSRCRQGHIGANHGTGSSSTTSNTSGEHDRRLKMSRAEASAALVTVLRLGEKLDLARRSRPNSEGSLSNAVGASNDQRICSAMLRSLKQPQADPSPTPSSTAPNDCCRTTRRRSAVLEDRAASFVGLLPSDARV